MMDPAQIEANITLEQTQRRASLLAAAAEVSQNITQLLDIDELLPKTVDIICEAYDFYYAGVFLIDDVGEFAVLKAGRGEPGQIMMENNHKLAVGGNSMIGACTAFNEARISLDVDTEKVWYPNPVLPETRSEMALPLAIGDRVIGAVTVQSVESAAFSDEDISSLQAMANQLAIAIDNARQRRELEETHAELLHAKTFEAIATATGDAIHWIGNKAEPIGGAIKRAEDDILLMLAATAKLLSRANLPADVRNQPLVQHLLNEANTLTHSNPKLPQRVDRILNLPVDKLKTHLSVASILEDLQITADAGQMIMKIKEDLIGPAREQAPRPVMLDDVVKDAISVLGVPPRVINLNIEKDLSLVQADSVQLNRVFVNLIENAYEAMGQQPKPQIDMTIYPDRDKEYMMVDVTDNGSGIAEEDIDKIWITFHTTKGLKGGTGLGLPACRLILEQMGGHISATSQLGKGSTFTVSVPIYKAKEPISREEPARGKILLLDDNDSWLKFAVNTLEGQGYKVTTASEVRGINNYKQFDLIIIDDILSENDSLHFMKTLRDEGVLNKTLAVSSNPRVERTKERKLLGLHDLIAKPYTRTKLLGSVKNHLQAIRAN